MIFLNIWISLYSTIPTIALLQTCMLLVIQVQWSELDFGNKFISYICDSNTVESSLFVEDQCLWLSWVSLVHEFTPPRTYIHKHLCNIHLQSRTCYQRNYDPTNLRIFDYPRTLTPTNKKDSTVNTFSKSNQGRIPTQGFLACRKKRLCDVTLIVSGYMEPINHLYQHKVQMTLFSSKTYADITWVLKGESSW